MFSFIKGTLIEKHPTVIVIEVGGIGYEISIPLSTYSKIPSVNETLKLHTYLHIREDAWQLFGFSTQEEKDAFKMLISISGIGPKLGLTILSGVGVDAFKKAVKNKDIVSLTSISGIGKKTAERIIVELKEKITIGAHEIDKQLAADELSVSSEIAEDTLTALMSLGYKRNEAKTALSKAITKAGAGQLSVEDLIRHSLTYI